MAIPKKYAGLDFSPTDSMIEDAQRGLDWRSEFGRGGTEVGIARARDIVNRRTLSPDTVSRMFSFFSRHEVDKESEGFRQGEDGYPSNGRIAWALWGGDSGFSWSRVLVNKMDSIDEEKTTMEKAYSIGAGTNLTTGTLSELGLTGWERGQVIPKIFEWARNEEGEIVPARARRAFLIVDSDNLDTQDGYKFPISVPNSDGVLTVTREAVAAAGSRLGALINNPENTDIPLSILERARTRLNHYRDIYQNEDKGMSITDSPVTQDGTLVVDGKEWTIGKVENEFIGANQRTAGLVSFSKEEEINAESNHQSKFGIIKSIVLDWLDSVFRVNKQSVEIEIEEVEEECEGDDCEDMPIDEEEDEKTIKILKNKSGRYVLVGHFSNSFRDDDYPVQEILSAEAQRKNAKRIMSGEVPKPELWLMHNEALKVGTCEYVVFDEVKDGKGVSIVFALFDEDKGYIAEQLMKSKVKLAMSHGYGRYPVIRDRRDKTIVIDFTDHEITIASYRLAANKLTSFEIIGDEKMIQTQEAEAIANELGIPKESVIRASHQSGKIVEVAESEARENKTLSVPSETENEQQIKTESEKAQVAEVLNILVDQNSKLTETLNILVDQHKTLNDRLVAMESRVKEQDTLLEKISTPIDEQVAKVASEISPVSLKSVIAKAQGLGGLSVIGRTETLVDERTRYGKDKPELGEQSLSKARYGDVQVGLGDDYLD